MLFRMQSSKTPRYDLASGRQSRLWSSRLWILAALLGVMTIVHTVGVVHDTRNWRMAVHSVVQSTAEQHARRLNERLQAYALPTFAPSTLSGGFVISFAAQELTRNQRAGEACHCRNLLPAIEFFAVQPSTGVVSRYAVDGTAILPTTVNDSTLRALALNVNAKKRDKPFARLSLASNLSEYGIVTWAPVTSSGDGVYIYGLIANAHSLIRSLVTETASDEGVIAADSVPRMLDTQSMQIVRADSTIVFGKLNPDHPYRAAIVLHGPMDGLGMDVALGAAQVPLAPQGQSSTRLWLLGMFLLSTVIVLVIAVGTSRREIFLARARSDFIAGTSHDFRMPLAQILLASETLSMRADASADERHGLTNSILRETRRLIGMVENVLLYSRSGAVEIKPAMQSQKVSEVFEDVVESVQLAVDDVGQSIHANVDGQIGVRADRQLLRQALVNLVDNAIKYGKPHQQILLGAKKYSPSLVHLWVDDEGPGVPVARRTCVFEPYERLTRDQASERAGSGLGLAVVFHIATICGGRVWIEDAPTGGARVGGARVVLELNSANT